MTFVVHNAIHNADLLSFIIHCKKVTMSFILSFITLSCDLFVVHNHSNFSAKTALLKKLTVQINGYFEIQYSQILHFKCNIKFVKPLIFIIVTPTRFVYLVVAQSSIYAEQQIQGHLG